MTQKTETAQHNVYVIELDKEVLQFGEFIKANPQYKQGMPCLYVGETRHAPRKRFNYHLVGYKSHEFVRRYARRLAPEYYAGINPVDCALAKAEEQQLADKLRSMGYAVWTHENTMENQGIGNKPGYTIHQSTRYHLTTT